MTTNLLVTEKVEQFLRTQSKVFVRHLQLKNNENHSDYHEVCIVVYHDFGEHGQRYLDFISILLKKLFSEKIKAQALIIDFPGHGKSSGPRGHIPSIENLALDCIDFINSQNLCHDTLFLGNSLGALINLFIMHNCLHLIDKKIVGLVALNPAFKLNWQLPHTIQKFLKTKTPYLSKLRLPFSVNGSAYFGKESEGETFDRDPLICHTPTVATFLEIQDIGKKLRTSSYYLDIPVFMGISDLDQLYNTQVSELYSRGLNKGTLKKYSNAPHDLIYREIGENVIKDIVQWYE